MASFHPPDFFHTTNKYHGGQRLSCSSSQACGANQPINFKFLLKQHLGGISHLEEKTIWPISYALAH